MGALRTVIVDCLAQSQGVGRVQAFHVELDCWQVSVVMQCYDGAASANPSNWKVNGVLLTALTSIIADGGVPGSSPGFVIGGFVHQTGHRGVPANFNDRWNFVPLDPAGAPCPLTIVKVYYDEGLTDTDFPG